MYRIKYLSEMGADAIITTVIVLYPAGGGNDNKEVIE